MRRCSQTWLDGKSPNWRFIAGKSIELNSMGSVQAIFDDILNPPGTKWGTTSSGPAIPGIIKYRMLPSSYVLWFTTPSKYHDLRIIHDCYDIVMCTNGTRFRTGAPSCTCLQKLDNQPRFPGSRDPQIPFWLGFSAHWFSPTRFQHHPAGSAEDWQDRNGVRYSDVRCLELGNSRDF